MYEDIYVSLARVIHLIPIAFSRALHARGRLCHVIKELMLDTVGWIFES